MAIASHAKDGLSMYGVSIGKRVCRGDIYSKSTSPEPALLDNEIELRLQGQLNLQYGLLEDASMQGGTTQELQATGTIPKEDKENEDCFEFRLFSRPTWNPVPSNETAVAPVRIDIRSPSPDIREIGFLEPRRPDDYYFTNGSSEQERKQYQSVAVSGEDILRQTEARWYGCALPWRVITVKNFQNLVTSNKSTPNKSVSTKKTRQGKKRRILLRKRLALTAEKEAIARVSKAGKEAAEREKKTRLNRAKKVRRKEKEKARKTIDLDKSV